ncbi:Calponin-homology (CH) domain-containing protein [Aphelenchoides besseyi]|nr:Calponin-homology (CH) domain-containing protein [Aphelenchoides besseyi]
MDILASSSRTAASWLQSTRRAVQQRRSDSIDGPDELPPQSTFNDDSTVVARNRISKRSKKSTTPVAAHDLLSSFPGCSAQLSMLPCDKVFQDAFLTGELDLRGRQLKEFPLHFAQTYDLRDLVAADLSSNRLYTFPPLDECHALETLQLKANSLRALPDATLKSLQSLTYLDLSQNQLRDLPSSLFSLPLKILLLSANRLESIPTEISRLADTLEELDLSANRLQQVPSILSLLTQLRVLNLRANQLTSVPGELGTLQVRILDLSGNVLIRLPTEFHQLADHCVQFRVDQNPLLEPPTSLARRGRTHIFKWLSSRAASTRSTDHPMMGSSIAELKLGSVEPVDFNRATTLRRTTDRRFEVSDFLAFPIELASSNSSLTSLPPPADPRHAAAQSFKLAIGLSGFEILRPFSDPLHVDWTTALILGFLSFTLPLGIWDCARSGRLFSLIFSLPLALWYLIGFQIRCTTELRRMERRSRSIRGARCTDSGYATGDDFYQQLPQLNSTTETTQTKIGALAEEILRTFEETNGQQANRLMDLSNNNVSPSSSPRTKPVAVLSPLVENESTSSVQLAATSVDVKLINETVSKTSTVSINLNGNHALSKSPTRASATTKTKPTTNVPTTTKTTASTQPIKPSSRVEPKKPAVVRTRVPTVSTVKSATLQRPATKRTPMGSTLSLAGKTSDPKPRVNGTTSRPMTKSMMSTARVQPVGQKEPLRTQNGQPIKSTVEAKRTTTTMSKSMIARPPQIGSIKKAQSVESDSSTQSTTSTLINEMRSCLSSVLGDAKLPIAVDQIAAQLADGVILCAFLNAIRPNAIPTVIRPSSSSSLSITRARRNIESFVGACREIGVPETILCHPADVLEKKNLQHTAKTVLSLRKRLCS